MKKKTVTPNMRRWSPAKLAKEAAFARSMNTGDAWLTSIESEITRRYGK